MAVWRLITHHIHPEDTLKWSLAAQRLAIGWGRIGNLSANAYESAEEIATRISARYEGIANAPSGGRCLWDFWRTMRPGDLVILSTGGSRQAVMRVTGPYEFMPAELRPPIGDYQHQRECRLTDIDADELWAAAGAAAADGYSIRWTLVRCIRDADPELR